jgi:hypothetical protein
MNLGQALGELQLEITTLQERRTRGERVDQGELDEAKADLLAFGLKLAAKEKEIESLHETVHKLRMAAKHPAPARKAVTSSAEVALREENVALESQLRAAHVQSDELKRRIARLEAASKAAIGSDELAKAQEQAADYKRHIERLEAEARGTGMQIAEIRRKLDEATALAGKRQQEIDELLKQPAKVVEVPSECPTCAPIIRAIAQAVQASNEPQAMPMPVNIEPVPCDKPSELLPDPKPMSIRQKILAALHAAHEPLTPAQIGEHIALPAQTVQNNLYHLTKSREVTRLIESGKGGDWDMRGRRYWLASRPLPQEVKA